MTRIRLTAVLVSFLVAGCAASTASSGREVRGSAPQRDAPVPAADARAVADGNATFAGRILDLLAHSQPTVALSPFSIADDLAMAYAGAGGQTATQMAAALDFRLPITRLSAAFGGLAHSLAAINRPGATLSVANAMYGQQGQAFRQAFLSVLSRYYDTGVRTVDFADATEAARVEISRWVSEQTRGKIPDLLAPGDVDPTTRLMLVNAVYLKARWLSPFARADSFPAPFQAPGGAVRVPTMHRAGSFAYARRRGYRVLELPYVGGRLAFDVLLPDPGKRAALERTLRSGGLSGAFTGLRDQNVSLALPKLELRSRIELAGALSSLGMPIAFQPQRADLSGIAGRPGELYISRVVHEAYIRVDEAGTEAAAATATGISSSSARGGPMVSFVVDRPFVFVLRDTGTGAVIFEGLVSHPQA
jgi:serpin B